MSNGRKKEIEGVFTVRWFISSWHKSMRIDMGWYGPE